MGFCSNWALAFSLSLSLVLSLCHVKAVAVVKRWQSKKEYVRECGCDRT
jgi:hypothetical protein